MFSRLAPALGVAALLAAPLPAVEPPLELPPWTLTVDATLAAGYRDNLLLSPANAESSSLLRAEVEAMLLRAPAGHWDGFAFLSAEENRYLSGDNAEHERSAVFAAEIRWKPPGAWKGGWGLQTYHQDLVLDVSVTDVTLNTAQLRVTGATTGPNLRWEHGAFFAETRLAARRDRYRDDLDGYDEGSGSLRLGYAFTPAVEFSVFGSRADRDHDTRQQFTLSGRPLAGTHLRTAQDEFLAEGKISFGPAKAHSVAVTLGRQRSADNGTGYFDFERDLARATLHAKTENWTHDLTVEYRRYEFPQQIVGLGLDIAARYKRDLLVRLETVRRLTPSLAILLVAEHERSASNDERSRYEVTTAYAGVRWSWDSLDRLLREP